MKNRQAFRLGWLPWAALWWSGVGCGWGQAVIAGSDPVIDVGGPDAWSNILYINESEPFDFAAVGESSGLAYRFSFWAETSLGTVTPFVAEVVEPDSFIVRAIGTTRRGGVDWTEPGLQTFDFLDGGAVPVQHGWAAGFISATPEGEEGGSPIAFSTAAVEGWLTGTSSQGSGTPAVVVGEAPVAGMSGTDADAYGKRRYAFQIAASLLTPLPPTNITAIPSVLRAGLTAGSVVARLEAADGNAIDAHTFSLVTGEGAADNALFAITGADLKAAGPLGGDGAAYSIRVRVVDGSGLSHERALAFSVLGNRPPTAVRLNPQSVLSSLPAGSVAGTLTTEDPNSVQGEGHSYELVGGEGAADNGEFSVEADRLMLVAEWEPGRSTYRIRVRSTDGSGLFREEALVLPVVLALGNAMGPRADAATDTAAVPILYTTGVEMPGPGTVSAVTVPLQSEAQLNLVFHMVQMRPTGEADVYDVVAESGPITVAGAVGGLVTLAFPNGPLSVQGGDLFFHFGRGIPFNANQGNARPIWYPCPVLPSLGEPLNLAAGNAGFPLRDDLQRDYAWAVHFTPGEPSSPLRLVEAVYDPSTRSLTLTWTSRPGQKYRIRASAGLASWDQTIETGISAAAGGTTSRTIGPLNVPGTLFYRVEETP